MAAKVRRKANRLRKLKITRVDTVDRGAQPDAFIVLAKRSPDGEARVTIAQRGSAAETRARELALAKGVDEVEAWRTGEDARERAEGAARWANVESLTPEPPAQWLGGGLDLVEIEKAEGSLAAFESMVRAAMVDEPTLSRPMAVLKSAREMPDLYGRAKDAQPFEKYGVRDPHEVRKGLDPKEEQDPRVIFEYRVRELMSNDPTMTRARARLIVCRQDPALYGELKGSLTHT